jgi:signal transduction histidine kinase
MGVLVHLVMLLCTFLLPVDQITDTLKIIAIPILSIYPLATVLLGTLMFRQFLNFQNRKASEKLRKSKTELIKARIKAEESDNLKSIFLANMSHEIRTPMNSIMGFSNLLGDRDLDESSRLQYLDIIKSSGNRLMQLINDILDLSKIEAKQLIINHSECSLSEILLNSTESFSKSDLLKKKPALELILNLSDDDKKIKFISDSNRVQQVLDNLLNNAIKYSEKGKIETGCSIVTEDNKEFIKIYVKDSGIGISEDFDQIVFERFRQVEEGRFHQGTGLGLSISKGMVELLGGKIWFVSKKNIGTTFYFTIPYVRSSQSTPQNNNKMELYPKLDGKNIIIAEDDFFSFKYLQLLLRGYNANITHAENGSVLLKMIKENVPDLILLDINMPVMSGFEFLSEIKKEGIKTKIIAQTAYAMPHERERCLSAGCTGYISKPVKKLELFEVINSALS